MIDATAYFLMGPGVSTAIVVSPPVAWLTMLTAVAVATALLWTVQRLGESHRTSEPEAVGERKAA